MRRGPGLNDHGVVHVAGGTSSSGPSVPTLRVPGANTIQTQPDGPGTGEARRILGVLGRDGAQALRAMLTADAQSVNEITRGWTRPWAAVSIVGNSNRQQSAPKGDGGRCSLAGDGRRLQSAPPCHDPHDGLHPVDRLDPGNDGARRQVHL